MGKGILQGVPEIEGDGCLAHGACCDMGVGKEPLVCVNELNRQKQQGMWPSSCRWQCQSSN